MTALKHLRNTTVFLGCGFAAKYREGGGNFSVPLQWMRGLVRLGLRAVWLEMLPASKDPRADQACIRTFQRRMHEHGLGDRYCLLHQDPAADQHDLAGMRCIGLSTAELKAHLAGPNILLNLSYSFHPPFLLQFERRIFCDIDPGEMSYWMARLEMGQSYHHDFWSIGLNMNGPDCRIPRVPNVRWKTFHPLVDTALVRRSPRPKRSRFTTVGQWYWTRGLEVDGEYPDLSKQAAFERFMTLPQRVPEVEMEMAMNLNPDDPEIPRIRSFGWRLVFPHRVVSTPRRYRQYIAGSLAEFTPCKGVDCRWRTGWVSDRAVVYLATGRPVITEDTGAKAYLPPRSGFLYMNTLEESVDAVRRVVKDWNLLSREARRCAVEVFDSVKNLRRILADG
jgi:hypothetical protein